MKGDESRFFCNIKKRQSALQSGEICNRNHRNILTDIVICWSDEVDVWAVTWEDICNLLEYTFSKHILCFLSCPVVLMFMYCSYKLVSWFLSCYSSCAELLLQIWMHFITLCNMHPYWWRQLQIIEYLILPLYVIKCTLYWHMFKYKLCILMPCVSYVITNFLYGERICKVWFELYAN